MMWDGLPRLPPKVYFPGERRNSSISSASVLGRIVLALISTTGTIPLTAIGSKSSSEYFVAFDTCGTTASSVVNPTSNV